MYKNQPESIDKYNNIDVVHRSNKEGEIKDERKIVTHQTFHHCSAAKSAVLFSF